MFRVNQSLVSSKVLNGLLGRFNTEETVSTVKTNDTHSNLVSREISNSPFKRRRRSRRVLALASTGLRSTAGASMRSTWF